MKSIMVVLFLLFVFSMANAQVSGFVENQNTVSENSRKLEINPRFNILLLGNTPVKNLKWQSWSIIGRGWAESYVGASYSPADWLSASVSIGVETGTKVLRKGADLWVGKWNVSSYTSVEDGGSGFWYKSIVKYNISTFGFGGIAEQDKGIGPYVEVKPLKNVKVWGGYFIANNEKKSAYLTLGYNF